MDVGLLVLHGLAVRKAGSAEAVAGVIGIAPGAAVPELAAACGAGHAIEANGTYMLTPPGRAWLDEQYPTACAGLRAHAGFVQAYEAFEVVNTEILDLFTRWQTISVGGAAVPNDHADEDYDYAIIDELGDVHERSLPVLDAFAVGDPRFSIYADRLASAYDRALAGEKEWVSGALVDSYHTVWFELHEDLLRVLGRTRRES
ncbi:MAG: hypothetical protein FJW96_05645 [Actinobacteria bacterium]|nr:hypothetical protein [Actinomycetota bacterium]